jgi:hypothetical protein
LKRNPQSGNESSRFTLPDFFLEFVKMKYPLMIVRWCCAETQGVSDQLALQ